MSPLLEQFRAAGVEFVALPDGNLRAHGTLTDAVRQSIRERKPAILAELAANDGAAPGEWYRVTRDGNTVDVAFNPSATLPEARAWHPDGNVEAIEPRPVSVATSEQAAELRALLAVVVADWPDRDEALEVALRDPADALTCFRMLAADLAPPERKYPEGPYTTAPLADRDPDDDRRTCLDCANLSAIGRCRTPPFAAKRDYHPIPDALNRCERYAPKPGEPDQRPGAERWPSLAEHAKRRSEAAQHGY